MNQEFEDGDLRNGSNAENAEETLRLVARLAPPEDLTARVHRRVRVHLAEESAAASRRGFWSLWSPVRRLQFAGAAVLAIAVGGGSWSVYQMRNAAHPALVPAPLSAPTGNGFGTAGKVSVPPTLTPIQVPPPPKKKAGAASNKRAAKPSAGKTVNPASQ
jgi:hypothetical protein